MAPFAITRSRFVSLSRSTHDAPQPARLVSNADAMSARASDVRGAAAGRRRAPEDAVELLVRVRDERGRGGRRRCSRPRRCPCPRSGRRGRRSRARSTSRKPSPSGSAAAPPLPRDVQVEPVRVGVVRDVEVGATVAVRVHEHGAEAVLGRAAVDARLLADLPEPGVAVRVVAGVEVEEVADALVVVREPCIGRVRERSRRRSPRRRCRAARRRSRLRRRRRRASPRR